MKGQIKYRTSISDSTNFAKFMNKYKIIYIIAHRNHSKRVSITYSGEL